MTIYVDLDGPVLDISERCFRVHREVVGASACPVSTDKADFWSLKRERVSIAELIARTASGFDEQTYRRRWLDLIEQPRYLRHDRVVTGAVAVLQALQKQHQLVLVTLRRHRPSLDWELETQGLRKLFCDVRSGPATSRTAWQVKAQLISDAGSAHPEGSMIVGDTETDILAGKALGLVTVATTNGSRTRAFLEALSPDFVIDNVNDLPGPVASADAAAEARPHD